MTVLDAASSYLRGNPEHWVRFCHRYLANVFFWMAVELQTETEGIRLSPCGDELSSLFFRPDFVREVAKSPGSTEADALIRKACGRVLAKSRLVAHHDDSLFSAAIVEPLSPTYRYRTASYIKSLDIGTLRLSIDDIFHERASADSASKSLDGRPTVLSLEVIDVNLYKALIRQPELLKTLPGRAFENLLADILDSLGYGIELQRGTKDGGIDIFALKRSVAFGVQRYLIQAKRWSSKVGIEPIRQLMFLHSYHGVTKSCLATTATFTKGAWQLREQYRWQLELRDFDGILDWLRLAAQNRNVG